MMTSKIDELRTAAFSTPEHAAYIALSSQIGADREAIQKWWDEAYAVIEKEHLKLLAEHAAKYYS
jgi:hypothetical protein